MSERPLDLFESGRFEEAAATLEAADGIDAAIAEEEGEPDMAEAMGDRDATAERVSREAANQ